MAVVHATRLQSLVGGQIKRFGQSLTVTRRPATTAGLTTVQTVYFLPQSVNARQVQQMIQEGQFNAAEDIPMNFKCSGSESITETLDKITYLGYYWRILKIVPSNPLDGSSMTLNCFAVREEVAG